MCTRGRLARTGVPVLVVAVLVFVVDAWLGPVEIGPYQVRLAALAYVALAFLCLPNLYARVPSTTWRLVVAGSLTGLPLAVVRPHSLAAASGWLAAGAVLTAVLLARAPSREARAGAPASVSFRVAALVVCAVAALAIGAFQLFNRHQLARGVPNEERSLILAGVEIHHLVWGVLLVAVVGSWGGRLAGGRWRSWSVLVALGVGLGMLVDQWLYFARIDPSDAAYFESATWISAWVGLGILLLVWQLVSNRY